MKFIAQVLVYEEASCLMDAVTPWLDVCERISVYEGAFKTTTNLGYPQRSTDGTVDVVCELSKHKNVKPLFHNYWNEPILRNDHLFQTIRDFGRDDTVLFILDGDEIYSPEEVKRCIEQVETEKDILTHWVNFKNYISPTDYHFGFRVPRFFKLKNAVGFSGYNNVAFDIPNVEADIKDVLPKHLSWTPIEKARRKIDWQTRALGWECSWAEKDGKLILNDSYYQKTGKIKPTIHHE